MRKMTMMVLASMLSACQAQSIENQAVEQHSEIPAERTGNAAVNTPVPAPPPSLPEPTGRIDPKSSEAAGQVVQHYGALIEQGRFAEAAHSWNDGQSAKEFAQQLGTYREVHLNIGELGQQEGAAGSIYLTEPVTFYGKTKSGSDFSRKAVVTLRRVNDVPGSTEAQRRWHIQSIEWSDA